MKDLILIAIAFGIIYLIYLCFIQFAPEVSIKSLTFEHFEENNNNNTEDNTEDDTNESAKDQNEGTKKNNDETIKKTPKKDSKNTKGKSPTELITQKDYHLYTDIIQIYNEILDRNPLSYELIDFFNKISKGDLDSQGLKDNLLNELRDLSRFKLSTGLPEKAPTLKSKPPVKKVEEKEKKGNDIEEKSISLEEAEKLLKEKNKLNEKSSDASTNASTNASTSNDPATNDPATNASTSNASTSNDPATNASTSNDPATNAPATNDPATNDPTSNDPVSGTTTTTTTTKPVTGGDAVTTSTTTKPGGMAEDEAKLKRKLDLLRKIKDEKLDISEIPDDDTELIAKYVDEMKKGKSSMILERPNIFNIYHSGGEGASTSQLDDLSNITGQDFSKLINGQTLDKDACAKELDKTQKESTLRDERNFEELSYKCNLSDKKHKDMTLFPNFQWSIPQNNSMSCKIANECSVMPLNDQTSLIGTLLETEKENRRMPLAGANMNLPASNLAKAQPRPIAVPA
jgi:hypothetical protein